MSRRSIAKREGRLQTDYLQSVGFDRWTTASDETGCWELPATNVRSTWNRPLVALVSVVLAPAAWGLLSRKGLLDECNEAALMQISYEADSISKSCVVRVHTLFLREVAARRGEANPCCLPLAGRTS